MADERKQVVAWTDGACLGNPGPGGYGVVLLYGEHRRELSGGYRLTTNNRMEIMAAIVALETLTQPCRVTLHSDSQYVVKAMSLGWARNWRARGWRAASGRAKNPDLWQRLLDAAERHEVAWQWVRGHAGIRENERADELATTAAQLPRLPADEGYESAAAADPL
jgi:ribonuclease HI